jgi:inhibitor of cysteine peptidase
VSITTFRSPGACIQIIAPFEETIPLEVYGLPAGTYTVNVNGVQGTFSLEVDNILPI